MGKEEKFRVGKEGNSGWGKGANSGWGKGANSCWGNRANSKQYHVGVLLEGFVEDKAEMNGCQGGPRVC